MSLILSGTDGLSDVDGTAATPAVRGTDTNTGIFFPAADTIAFSEGGVEAARFDSSGNLGLGTTSPTAKLDVSGTAAVSGSFAVAGNNISAVNSLGFRNRIINGDMRIDQRNAGASITANDDTYAVDRFKTAASQSSKLTAQRNAGSATPPAGFSNYLGYTSSSAYSVGASDYFVCQQGIEGFNTADLAWGTASAQAITLSFWVRSSLTGTFGGSLRNASADRSYPFTYTISAANTWEQKTVNIAGDTSGTWGTGNGIGISLGFGLGVGSTLSGTAGSWAGANYRSATGAVSVVGTNGATFYITGVQLEAGSVATPFERRDYGRELMMCQRYYAKTYEVGTAPGTNTSEGFFVGGTFAIDATTTWGASWRFPVSMRANPTVTFYTSAGTSGSMNYAYKGFSATGGVVSFGLGETAVGMYHNGTASGLTAGEGVVIYGNIVASAEL